MIERARTNLQVLGRGRLWLGALVVVAGCLVLFAAAGLVLSQPTVAVGVCIGWVVACLCFGGGAGSTDVDRTEP